MSPALKTPLRVALSWLLHNDFPPPPSAAITAENRISKSRGGVSVVSRYLAQNDLPLCFSHGPPQGNWLLTAGHRKCGPGWSFGWVQESHVLCPHNLALGNLDSKPTALVTLRQPLPKLCLLPSPFCLKWEYYGQLVVLKVHSIISKQPWKSTYFVVLKKLIVCACGSPDIKMLANVTIFLKIIITSFPSPIFL